MKKLSQILKHRKLKKSLAKKGSSFVITKPKGLGPVISSEIVEVKDDKITRTIRAKSSSSVTREAAIEAAQTDEYHHQEKTFSVFNKMYRSLFR